jgi:tRNA-dihydrouridine synthase
MLAYKTERQAILEMRKHLAWYLKGLRNTAALKEALLKCVTKREICDLLGAWLNGCGWLGHSSSPDDIFPRQAGL